MTDARVTVVMPVYNAQPYLDAALHSLRTQTFEAFEAFLVDDGSSDDSLDILERHAREDARFHVLRQGDNQGVVAALNRGCQAANAPYLAICHADDINHPERLTKQVAFLDSHPEVGLIGSSIRYINLEGKPLMVQVYPQEPPLVGWTLYFNNALAHPVVMMRRDIFEQVGAYREGTFLVEDYDLWLRMEPLTQVANLPDVLLDYRQSGMNLSARYKEHVPDLCRDLLQHYLAVNLGLKLEPTLKPHLYRMTTHLKTREPAILRGLARHITQMVDIYSRKRGLDTSARWHLHGNAAVKILALIAQTRPNPPAMLDLIVRSLRLRPDAPLLAWQAQQRVKRQELQNP